MEKAGTLAIIQEEWTQNQRACYMRHFLKVIVEWLVSREKSRDPTLKAYDMWPPFFYEDPDGLDPFEPLGRAGGDLEPEPAPLIQKPTSASLIEADEPSHSVMLVQARGRAPRLHNGNRSAVTSVLPSRTLR